MSPVLVAILAAPGDSTPALRRARARRTATALLQRQEGHQVAVLTHYRMVTGLVAGWGVGRCTGGMLRA